MKVAVTAFTREGEGLAERLEEALRALGHTPLPHRAPGQGAGDWARAHFAQADALIFVGAAGIAVRAIAPLVCSKTTDPAVLVADEGGRFLIPILSGHLGGGAALPASLAGARGAGAGLTAASDGPGPVGLVRWAGRMGLTAAPASAILGVSRDMLAGRTVSVWSRWPIAGALPQGLCWGERDSCRVRIDWHRGDGGCLCLTPRAVFGVGCRRGTGEADIRRAFEAALEESGLLPQAVRWAATLDRKGDEPGLLAFCARSGLRLRTFTPGELAAQPGTFTPSPFVSSVTGVDNVCERACAAAGGTLILRKRVYGGVTAALGVLTPALDWRSMA